MAIVTFKCTDAEKAEIEARSNGNVSRYIKERLFGTNDRSDLLFQILDRIDAGGGGPARAELGMLTELLLLMRMSVKPDAHRQAQAEVERLGLEVWTSESGSRRK